MESCSARGKKRRRRGGVEGCSRFIGFRTARPRCNETLKLAHSGQLLLVHSRHPCRSLRNRSASESFEPNVIVENYCAFRLEKFTNPDSPCKNRVTKIRELSRFKKILKRRCNSSDQRCAFFCSGRQIRT